MKKFAKMLALGLALAMTFGMVVSAAENPSVVTKVPENVEIAEGSTVETVEATAKEEENVVKALDSAQAKPVNTFGTATLSVKKVLGTYYFKAPEGEKKATVVLDVSDQPALAANENYAFLHVNEDGKADYINLGKPDKDGIIKKELSKFSPYTLIVTSYTEQTPAPAPTQTTPTTPATPDSAAPVSPKTGETLPVAGMMAVLCLAGALVCAKKARCNN